MNKIYVQFGCGLSAPSRWINFDASPTLRLQRIPLIGLIFKRILKPVFPDNAVYADIIKGLPIKNDSCDGLYSSHVLEHLSLNDFRLALRQSYKILKPGGFFRIVVPDLESAARNYVTQLDSKSGDASLLFMESTMLGEFSRSRGLSGFLRSIYGNSKHRWMWDKYSLSKELNDAGFNKIRFCVYGDCSDGAFKAVEDPGRFVDAVAIECSKL